MDRQPVRDLTGGGVNDDLSDEPVLKHGMVLKRGRKVTSTWKKRYFVLRPTTLSYHAGADTENEEKRYIEITQNSTVTHRKEKHPLCFQVRTPGYRKITARCETEEDLHLWMSAIEECIRRAPAWPIKCVVVGDEDEGTFGKRVMVSRYLDACRSKIEDGEAKMMNSHGYTLDKSRTRIVRTPDELGNVDILLEYEKGEWVKLMLWHLDGTEECTKLRALAYPHSDIYIVVFSVSNARSFEKAETYMKEIKQTIKDVPTGENSQPQHPLFLLVGTRLSSELVAVGFNQGEEKARALGFAGYVECRIDSEEDCGQVFTDAVRLVVEKSVVVYAPNELRTHIRNSSGILAALANRLRSKKSQKDVTSGAEDVKSIAGEADDSPDTSPVHQKKKGFGFFASSEKLVTAALSPLRKEDKGRKSDLSSQAESIKSSTSSTALVTNSPAPRSPTSIHASANDGDEDSDEGSLIGVEIDDADEDAKARLDRDFGLSSMKEDPQYTQRVLHRNNSRRSGEQAFGAGNHRSLGSPDKDLFDIVEMAAEDRERELEELRLRNAKREREIERMKVMMDSLKTYNKAVEEQLKAMREELAVVNKRGGAVLGAVKMPPLASQQERPVSALEEAMPKLSLPPPSTAISETSSAASSGSINAAKGSGSSSSLNLPPLPPGQSPARSSAANASAASWRAGRSNSVFF